MAGPGKHGPGAGLDLPGPPAARPGDRRVRHLRGAAGRSGRAARRENLPRLPQRRLGMNQPKTKTNMQNTMRVVNTELFRNAAAITLSFNKKWGNSRKIPIDQAQQPGGVIRRDMTDEEKKEIKRRLKLSTNLIISPEYDAIGTFHGSIKKTIVGTPSGGGGMCVQSRFKKGFYLAKVAKIGDIDKLIAEANKKLKDELVPAFIKAFPAQKEEARLVMEPKGMFRD